MDKLYNLTIDTKLKTYQKIYGMKQFENNVVLNITLVQNSVPLDLSGCTVRLNYQNKNEVLLQMANIISEKEGKVRVTVLTKVLDTTGETPVDISVFDADQRKITSSTFVLVVQESIYNNDKIDEEELDLIQDIYSKEKERQEAEKQRETNEKQREENDKIRDDKISKIENDCQECKEEINTQIHKFNTQEEERKVNEIERINNENARKTDEQQRVKQENAREENEKVRVTSETKRVESMDTIEKEWEEIKKDLGSQGGTGDMMKAIYDKNNDGVVDNSEKLGNVAASMYIQKQNKTTWQDINVNEDMNTGDTPTVKLSRPKVTDELLLKPLNDNFTKIDEAINKAGYGLLYKLYNVSLDEITTSGTYMVQNLKNAPDTPYGGWRMYLVKCYVTDLVVGDCRMYEIYSYGTGKRYLYDSVREKYSDIPCTSPIQDSEIYIDSVNGDDTAAGYKSSPVKTWNCAYSRIPKILIKPITIIFLNDCEENIILDNISTNRDFSRALNTWIFIKGNNHTLSSLTITDCHTSGGSWGISLYQVETKESITVLNSSVVNINVCEAIKIVADDSVIRCDVSTIGTYIALNRAFIQVAHHTTPEIKQEVGCHATFGSTIYVQGTHPQGSTGEKFESTGGKVEYES